MSDSLRKHLSDLHGLVERKDATKGNLLLADIKGVINGHMTTASELELYASLLLNDSHSLLNFMKRIYHHTELTKCLENGLLLLKTTMDSIPSLSSPHVGNIVSTILEIYPSCRSSSVKEKIIGIIILVVKTKSRQIDCGRVRKMVQEELSKRGKCSSSVKCSSFHLLGLLCQYYPDEMSGQNERLLSLYLRELRREFEGSSDLKVIEGCLKGLRCVLFEYKIDSPELQREVLKYSMQSMQPKDALNRYAVPIAGLKMIQYQVHQFGYLVVEQYEKIYKVLKRWFLHKNTKVKHEAHVAIQSFLKQIVQVVGEEMDAPASRGIYMYFVTEFQNILESSDASSKQVSIAIQGYGLFAKLCRKYMDRAYLPKMLSVMMSKTSKTCLRTNKYDFQNKLDQLHHMSSFLFSLSNILQEVLSASVISSGDGDHNENIISESFMRQLLQLCFHMIEGFQILHTKFHTSSCLSLLSVMTSLSLCPDYQENFISQFAFHGLVISVFSNLRNSSNPHQIPIQGAEEMKDIYSDLRMEKANRKYVDLWKGLILTPLDTMAPGFIGTCITGNHLQTKKMLFSQILQSIHKMLKKMEPYALVENHDSNDLSPHLCNIFDLKETSNHDTMKALSGFFKKFLPPVVSQMWEISSEAVASQVGGVLQTLMKISMGSEFTVGANEMLTTLVIACDDLKYFDMDIGNKYFSKVPNHWSNVQNCKRFFQKCIPEIIATISESNSEAANSALMFLFSLPSEIALTVLETLVKPLQMAFRVGLGNVKIAEVALTALERWKQANKAVFPVCFLDILPDIVLYISRDDVRNTQALSMSRSHTNSMRNSTKSDTDEQTMKEFRKRVAKFLGSVSSSTLSISAEVPKLENTYLGTGVSEDQLCYAIPMPGIDVKLPIGTVLTDACELAQESSDRQTKLTASEVLQSFIVYVIGQVSESEKQSRLAWAKVFKNLVPEVIKLACDSDPVIRSLFQSLVTQTIHCFADKDDPISTVLLDVITNGLVDETNEFQRSFCAQCLGEYITWIAKHHAGTNGAVVKHSRPIFQQLCNFARHPDCTFRVGAALGFKELHKIVGENKEVLHEFIFQLLRAFVDGLAHSHSDRNVLGPKVACSQALTFIENIIIANKDTLILEKCQYEGGIKLKGRSKSLQTILEWLLEQSARPESDCRQFCMGLTTKLSTLFSEVKTFPQWIQQYIENNGAAKLYSLFDGASSTIKDVHDLSSSGDRTALSIVHSVEQFLASVDCYHWAFVNDLLSPDKLAKGLACNLLGCLDHFIDRIVFCGLENLIGTGDSNCLRDSEILHWNICQAVTRILELVLILFKPHYVREDFTSESILKLIAMCLFDPITVGSTISEEYGESKQLSLLISNILCQIHQWHSLALKRKSVSILLRHLKWDGPLSDPMESIIESSPHDKIKLVWSYQILLNSSFLRDLLPEMTVDKQYGIAKSILKYTFSSFVNMAEHGALILPMEESLNQESLHHLLKLAFQLGIKSDDLVDLIRNKTVVFNVAGEQLVSSQGALFFAKYNSVLCEEICSHPQKYVAAISELCDTEAGMNILNGVLSFLSDDRNLCIRWGSDFIESVFSHWMNHLNRLTLKESSHDSLSAGLLLISKLVAVHPKNAIDTKHARYEAIFRIFSSTLKSKSVPLYIKNEILAILDCFVSSENLKSCLHEFCSIHFPSKSTEFQEGSQKFETYVVALKHMLTALEKTGSPEIMTVLASVFCREESHILQDDFTSVLKKCLLSVSENTQKKTIDSLYTLHSSSPHSVLVRCRVSDMILLPLLSQCCSETVKAFFISHIGEIITLIAEDLKKVSVDSWKDKLAMKSSAYKLAEVMFKTLPKEMFTSESSELSEAYASSTIGQGSTKVLKNFMSHMLRDKLQDITFEKKLLHEELRQFNCCVFNAAIAAVICTQTEIKWFDAFIFSHNPKKKDILFENIIDETRTYSFPWLRSYDLNLGVTSTLIRNPIKIENETYEPTLSSISSFRYDVGRFDLNVSTSGSDTQSSYDSRLDIQGDSMNEHECMQNLISAVFYMEEKNIGFPIGGGSFQSPAKWINNLIHRINSDAHINVKLFIVKLIINCGSILEIYCGQILVPVIKVIVQYMRTSSNSRGRNKIDQFVEDALLTVLCWKQDTLPKNNSEELLHIRALVETLMQHCSNESQVTFKKNLRLFKATVQCFRGRLTCVNMDFIYRNSIRSTSGSYDALQSLHIMASVVTNGLPPYTPSLEVERIDFFERIFGFMMNSSKSLVDVSSGIMGMSLKYIANHEKETVGEIRDVASNVVRTLANSAKNGGTAMGTFIFSLFRVAKYYPPVAEPFVGDILYLLPKVPSSEMKILCIETIRSCISNVDNIVAELKAKNFLDMLMHRNEPLQLSCMKLLSKVVDLSIESVKQKKQEVESYIQCVDFFLHHVYSHILGDPSLKCRQEMYSVAMKVFDFQNSLASGQVAEEIMNDSKSILIHGLGDAEEILRLQVMNFWADNLHLVAKDQSSHLGGKLMALFQHLYSPEADELGFLSSCCNILMRSSCKNPKFMKDIFNSPLFDCQYEKLSLSQYLDPDSQSLPNSDKNTESVNSDTLTQRSIAVKQGKVIPSATAGTYNWMTGETYCDTDASNTDMFPQHHISRGSSMIPGVQSMRKRKKQLLKEITTHEKYLTKKARRNSFDDKMSSSPGFPENKLRIYRTYRTGQLPDTKISHRDMVIPLTALTQRSSAFLLSLMSTLINAILLEQNRKFNEKYLEEFSHVLENMLSKSKHHNPTFIACILTVVLRNITSLSVDTTIISQAAKKSGIRIIEEKLMNSRVVSEPRRKRTKVQAESLNLCKEELHEWMELARLYHNDFDMLRGIFSMPSIARSLFSEMIQLESNGEYGLALKMYEKVLAEGVDSETNEVEKTLWEDCLVNCLEKLAKWAEIDSFCMKQMDGELRNSWDSIEFQERFLLPSLHAKSFLMLQGSVGAREELWAFFEESLKDNKVQKQILERDHSYLIALVQAHKGDYGQALFYLNNALDYAGNRKQACNKNAEMSQLLHLADLLDYLELMRNDSKKLSISQLEELCEHWSQKLPSTIFGSLNVWEDMFTCRSFFLHHLVESLLPSTEQDHIVKRVDELKIDFIVKSVDQACKENCFNKARKFLNVDAANILQKYKSESHLDFRGSFKYELSLGKYYLNYSSHLIALNKSPRYFINAASALSESYRCLKKASQSTLPDCSQADRSLVYSLMGQNFNLASDLMEYKNLEPAVLENLCGMFDSSVGSDQVRETIYKEGYDIIKSGVDATFEVRNVTANCVKLFTTFSELCDRMLIKNGIDISDNEEAGMSPKTLDVYAEEIIKYTLRAMQHAGIHESTQEAAMKFPRLLQLIEQFPDLKTFFVGKAEKVPSWVFLKWISQMIAVLDKPESDGVHAIIEKLGAEYSQAVVYPLKTSIPQFHHPKTESGKRNKNFVSRLSATLDKELPSVGIFIKSLTLLGNPLHVFKNWQESTINILRSNEKSTLHAAIITDYQNMYNELFAPVTEHGSHTLTSASSLHGKFAEEFREDVEKAFGGPTGGPSLLNKKQFQSNASGLIKKMAEFLAANRPTTLKEYSPWLSDFHTSCFERSLEIPGQYKEAGKPMPEYHAKIVGFEESVLVLESLQQPKKIIMKGSDSKKYPYMVKGNEDLRQDQRIQQLLMTVNVALQKDPACFQRNLKIETYQVVPVTNRLGLVEWVEDTLTIYDMLLKELKKNNHEGCMDRARQKYDFWLLKYSASKSEQAMLQRVSKYEQVMLRHRNMMKKATYKDVITNYREVIAEMPAYTLRESLRRLCVNAESFVILRKQFVSQYGTLCAIHWILGIGDRHASNCLISEKTGSVIGIDFGHAFGSATEILPIPELVPFRLTAQIQNVMAPHLTNQGLLRQSMLHTLHAMRTNQGTIFTMLDIFLKEPSVDWMKRASKLSRLQDNSSASSSKLTQLGDPRLSWYPTEKIDQVKSKLRGGNPAILLRKELFSNLHVSSHVEAYRIVADGVGPTCQRTEHTSPALSVDDQVDCLMDLASDPNVLGRTFAGWRFWL